MRAALVRWEFRAAWVVWIDPIIGNHGGHSKRRWDIFGPNELIGALMPVIDARFLITQWHPFKAIAVNRLLNPGAKLRVFA